MSSQRVWGAPLGRVQPALWWSKSRVVHVGWPRCGLVTWQYQRTLGIAVSLDAGGCWVCSHLALLLTCWNHFSVSIRPKADCRSHSCDSFVSDTSTKWSVSISVVSVGSVYPDQWFRNCMACIGLCVVTSFYIPAAKMTLKAVLYLYVSYF